jgi:hypothetical protein
MNHSRCGILIPFSKSVVMSKSAHLLLTTTFVSCCSVSITLHCASTIVYTFVVCYIINYTSVDSCSSCAIMFSSLVSFYIVYASIKWWFITSSSFDSSMHTGWIDVDLVLSFFLHTNIVYICTKTQPQIFQLHLCLELLSTQIVFSHYMLSILDIPKMMMNATTTL